jgi:hypothetical protein
MSCGARSTRPLKGAAAMVMSGDPATDFLGWGAERSRRPLHSSTSLSLPKQRGRRELLNGDPRPPIVALRGATAAIGSLSESKKSECVFFNTALAENALSPMEFRDGSPSSLGRKKATQRNRASHCSVDLRGCRTNYSSCAKNNFEEVVHGHGVVDYPTKQCAKRQTNIFMER